MIAMLRSTADLDAAFAASDTAPVVIFKHSATCPFSALAQEQVALSKHDANVYVHVVQYGKELSEAIAERTGVEHASPQAIVVDKGEAVWSGWRSEIQKDRLLELAASPQEER